MFGNSAKDSRSSNIATGGVVTAGKFSASEVLFNNIVASGDVTANRFVSQIGDISKLDCNIFAADTILTYASSNLNETTLNGITTLVNIAPNSALGTNANNQIVAIPGLQKVVFNSNTFWTVPLGVNTITAICTGAGGTGGLGDPNVNGGGGGGGSCGSVKTTLFGVIPTDALQITIGDSSTPAQVVSNGTVVASANPGNPGLAGSNQVGGDGASGTFGGGGGSVVTAGTQGLGGATTGYNAANSGTPGTDTAGGNGGGGGGFGGQGVGGGGGGGGKGGGDGGDSTSPNGKNVTGVGSGGGGSAGSYGPAVAGLGGPGQVTFLYSIN